MFSSFSLKIEIWELEAEEDWVELQHRFHNVQFDLHDIDECFNFLRSVVEVCAWVAYGAFVPGPRCSKRTACLTFRPFTCMPLTRVHRPFHISYPSYNTCCLFVTTMLPGMVAPSAAGARPVILICL